MSNRASPPSDPNQSVGKTATSANSFSHILAELTSARATIRDAGVRLASGNRLDVYIRAAETEVAFDLTDGALPSGRKPPSRKLLHQLAADGRQLALAARELGRQPAVPGWADKMQIAVGGSLFPQSDREARARNTQFELFLAGCFRRAGYAIELEEPDFVVHPGAIAFAAKRVRSPRKLQRNLRQASSQIVRSGKRGVIAIDLSVLVNPDNDPLPISAAADVVDLLASVTSSFKEALARHLHRDIKTPPVSAVLVYVSALAFVPNATPRQLHTARRLHMLGLSELDFVANLTLQTAIQAVSSAFDLPQSAV